MQKVTGTCHRDGEGAARAAHCVLNSRERKDVATFWAEVGITTKTRHLCSKERNVSTVLRADRNLQ